MRRLSKQLKEPHNAGILELTYVRADSGVLRTMRGAVGGIDHGIETQTDQTNGFTRDQACTVRAGYA
jgi:hypothetical protein